MTKKSLTVSFVSPEVPQHHVYEEVLTHRAEEQFALEQDSDTFTETPTNKDSGHSEPNMDQLHSHISPVEELQDEEGSNQEEPGPSSNSELKSKKGCERSRSQIVKTSSLSESQCDVDSGKDVVKWNISVPTLKKRSSVKNHGRIYTGEKPDSGNTCGKSLCASSALQVHSQTDERKSKPDNSCGTSFSHLSSLNHQSNVDSHEKIYSCKLCGQTFKYNWLLWYHLRSHKEENALSCEECGKCFKKLVALINHTKFHKGQKSRTCKECGKCFGHRTGFLKHMRIHTGEKPYPCSNCGKSFTVKQHLQVHMKVHTGKKQYACKDCEDSFSRKSYLLTYMTTHC